MSALRAESTRTPIAIVGIGCRFPGGITDPSSFWRVLSEGVDAITEIPPNRMDVERFFDPQPATPGRMMSRLGGFLDHIEEFDPEFFGIAPREAKTIDPQQRLLLEAAWEALEDAGQNAQLLEGSRTAVFVGQWVSDFESRLFADPEGVDFAMTTGSGRYATSGRISYVLGLRGPSLTIDSACSSSLAAVHLAVRSIRSGESELALAGGVNMILQPQITIGYSQSRMMAQDGHCKFGDASGDGYVRSEGAGLVVLKALDRAIAAGDRIYAVIRGSAVNNDGRSSGVLGRPSRIGHEEMLRDAYDDAGVAPARVGYVEAHGTGTRAGDPVEIAALGAVLGAGREAASRCLIGSVKTNIGHTEGAAGIAGLIKAALAVHKGVIPPSLHFVEPNPNVPWADLPFQVPTANSPWPKNDGPRVAGVNSFGIAGTNAHVVLEQAPLTSSAPVVHLATDRKHEISLLPLSAKSREALQAMASRYAELLEADGAPFLQDVCWSAATRRTALEYRAVFVAADRFGMLDSLRRLSCGEAAADGIVRSEKQPRIAFVVPGQGAQWTGMARELALHEPIFRATLQQCDASARSFTGWSIVEQLAASPESPAYLLDRIDVIQPVLVAVAIAYAALWRSKGVVPDAVVGHSMGEVGAACIAGVLDLAQAMRIICRRSALMRRTSGNGAMAMVELAMDEARARIKGREEQLSVAVSNSPRSSVISGEPEAVQRVMAELEREQVFCRLVKVDVASHSPQMEPLAIELAAELAGLVPHEASIPVYSTVLGRRAEASEFDAAYWARNLRQPVLFSDTINRLIDDGVTVFIELGPHPVLLPSVQQTAQSLNAVTTTIACGRRDEPEHAGFVTALGALWASGVTVDWRLALPAAGKYVPLPLYPWQRERHWADAAEIGAALLGGRTPKLRPDDESLAWLHTLRWRLSEPPTVAYGAGTARPRWLVVAADESTASDLAKAMVAAGALAHAAPLQKLASFLEQERPNEGPPTGVILLAPDTAEAGYLPIQVLQVLLRSAGHSPPRLWFVTSGSQSIGIGLPARVAVDAAALWGAARVIGEEHPECWGGLVDLDPAETLANSAPLLVRHLLASDCEDQIALRGNQRFVLRLTTEQHDMAVPAFTWRTDAAYLITGGLGGVGLHIARTMVARGVRRLVLFGRTALPERDQWSRIPVDSTAGQRIAAVREFEAAGVAVHLASVDVSDENQLRSFFDRYAAEAWPPIRGVIHAAGALDNQLSATMDRRTFDAVLRPKLVGAQLLDRLLPNLDLFILFSSTGAFLAQAGQANYAAANAGLDALAQDRHSRGLPALSVAWGVWKNTGLVKGEAGERNVGEMARQGIQSFAPERGAALFGWLCGQTEPNIVVLPVDWAAFRRARSGRDFPLFHELFAGTGAGAADPADLSSRLASASLSERRRLLEGVVRENVGRVLKIAPSRLDPRKALGSMGLNSLMAMELRNRLEAALARSLSATLAWNHPTVEALAQYLAGSDPTSAAQLPDAVPVAPPGDLSTRLNELAGLSDEDAALALRTRRPRA